MLAVRPGSLSQTAVFTLYCGLLLEYILCKEIFLNLNSIIYFYKLGLSYNDHIWAKLPKYLCSETYLVSIFMLLPAFNRRFKIVLNLGTHSGNTFSSIKVATLCHSPGPVPSNYRRIITICLMFWHF